MRTTSPFWGAVWLLCATATPAFAANWYVAPNTFGNGSISSPFGRIQDAVKVALPGDVVIVSPGTYAERITSVRAGTAQLPITVRARDGRGSATVTAAGRVLTVGHAYLTIDSLVLDGQFGLDDIVRVGDAATRFTLRNSEVRRTSKDAVDIGAPVDVSD